MAYIYAYSPDEIECANIGLVGALMDRDAEFDLQAGEFGELSFTHPIDPWGKWKALAYGVILKTQIPVRLVPEVNDGAYIGSVDIYKVKSSATKYQRYIYYAATASKDPTYEADVTRRVKGKTIKSKVKKTKHKKLLSRGTQVTVIQDPRPGDNSYRYKVRVKSGKKKVTGYMEKDALKLIEQQRTIPQTDDGLETVSASYAIQQQLFRIYSVETSADDDDTGTITVHARRLVYDLLSNITTYKATTNVSCQTVCRGVLDKAMFPHDFTVFSDIGDKHVGVDMRDMNPIAALIDPDEGVVGRWGGEVVCDDYDIYVLRNAGKNRGVTIKYGKNLTGIECTVDYSDVTTAIRPIGTTASGAKLYIDGSYSGGRYRYNGGANTLSTKYRFARDDDGNLKPSIIERNIDSDGYATPMAHVLEVNDAKVTKTSKNTDPSETSVLTVADARKMLVDAAIEMFDAGCDVPDMSLEVDFTLLGDTVEYAQYRHLEPMFVYDTVKIYHSKLNVEASVQLTSITWNVRQERIVAATFGSLGDAVAKLPGYSLPKISGGKIIAGSVDSGAMAEESISADHIQANSINSDHIMARSIVGEHIKAGEITADHLAAGAVDAQSITAITAAIRSLTAQDVHAGTLDAGTLAASFAHLMRLVAEDVSAGTVVADTLSAVLMDAQVMTVKTADFDSETVKHLIGSVLQVTELLESRLAMIDNLYVTQANLANATLDRLTVLGTDGQYYDIAVGSDGLVLASVRGVTAEEIAAGETSDGRGILPTAYDMDTLADRYLTDPESGMKTLYVEAISTGKITAQEAFIGSARIPDLEATVIRAVSDRLMLYADEAVRLFIGRAGDYNSTFDFTTTGLRTRIGDSLWSTLVTNDGFYIDHAETAGHVGAFRRGTFEPRSIKMGRTICRPTGAGGWSWSVEGTEG